MEFLKQRKHRTALSEVLYVSLNILLALAIFGLVLVTNTPVPALILVLLGKWRMLAVRPRFWVANVKSNLVDIIVSISYVIFLTTTREALWLQIAFVLLYIAWLVVIKPRSRRVYMVTQAAVALAVGTMAVSAVAYNWWASVPTLLLWVVGYAVTRQVVLAYKQPSHGVLLSLIGGLVLAELGWIAHHWMIAYTIADGIALQLPQLTIIAMMVGLIAERAYASYIANDGKITRSDMVLPLLMTVSVLVVILVVFNAPETSLQ